MHIFYGVIFRRHYAERCRFLRRFSRAMPTDNPYATFIIIATLTASTCHDIMMLLTIIDMLRSYAI